MAIQLKDLITTITQQSQQQWQLFLLHHWNAIVGDLHQYMRLEKINADHSLLIGVYDSTWLQELYYLSPVLLKNINDKLTHPYVTHLRFRYVDKKTYQKNKPFSATVPQDSSRPLTLTAQQHHALVSIHDNDLRQALYKFLVRCTME